MKKIRANARAESNAAHGSLGLLDGLTVLAQPEPYLAAEVQALALLAAHQAQLLLCHAATLASTAHAGIPNATRLV